jgi:transcriptional regulator with XRE-family HTH domain
MQKNENNSFSRKVRMLRLDYGLTQPNLAKLMDVSVRTVASWESGKKRRHEEMLWEQISKAVELKYKGHRNVITNSQTGDENIMWKNRYEQKCEEYMEQSKLVIQLQNELLELSGGGEKKQKPLSKKKRA